MTPEPAQPAESPEAIPNGVSYSVEHDNFYADNKGMGEAFWRKWKHRSGEFPATTTARPTERGAVEEALGHLEWLCGIAYNQGGAHELGYDPLEVVRAALTPPVTVAATDQAGEVEREAVGAFLEACATIADEQHDKYAGYPAIQRDLKAEAKAYRNVVRMVRNEDHARYRTALATQPATGRTMGGEDGA